MNKLSKIKTNVKSVLFVFVLLLSTFANFSHVQASSTGKITASWLAFRQTPSLSGTVLGYIKSGTVVNIEGKKNEWYQVSYQNKTGYVYGAYLQVSQTAPVEQKVMKKVVAASGLNVRTGPSTRYPVISFLPYGTVVEVSKVNNGWAVILINKKSAYISNDFLQEVSGTKTPTVPPKETPKPAPSEPKYVEYTVQPGDTLFGLFLKFKVSVNDIKSLNGLTNDVIVVGQKLKISVSDNTTTPPKKEDSFKETYVIAKPRLNVRSGTSTSSSIVGTLEYGSKIKILKTEGKWALMEYLNLKGYVHTDYLSDKPLQTDVTLKGKTIILDAGHGGRDVGALGNGLRETDLNLRVTLKTKSLLEQKGAKVMLTRSDETFVELMDRAKYASVYGGDLFVSIHTNSSYYSSATGIETYYYSSSRDQRLASLIYEDLKSHTNLSRRDVHQANFMVLKYNSIPSTLIEMGFITNSNDARLLNSSSYQTIVANAVVNGIVNYYR